MRKGRKIKIRRDGYGKGQRRKGRKRRKVKTGGREGALEDGKDGGQGGGWKERGWCDERWRKRNGIRKTVGERKRN